MQAIIGQSVLRYLEAESLVERVLGTKGLRRSTREFAEYIDSTYDIRLGGYAGQDTLRVKLGPRTLVPARQRASDDRASRRSRQLALDG